MKKTFKIEVDCANCAAKVEDAVNKIDGVEKAVVNFMTQKMTIEAPEDMMAEIVKKAEKAGKKVDDDFEILG
ncbi:MAG: cation transporter [Faecalicoccus sp.]|jgi:copper chaperone CopZ|nr:cation transporter [Faecalicoccus sp.]